MNGSKLWWSIDAAITRVAKWGLFVSIACLAYMLVMATVDVITTKFFDLPIPMAYDSIEELNIPMIFMGLAYVQLERGHIVSSLFEKQYSEAVKKAIELGCHVVGIMICGLLGWGAMVLLQSMIALGHTKQGLIPFPLWPFSLSLFLGLALLTIAYILSIFRAVAKK